MKTEKLKHQAGAKLEEPNSELVFRRGSSARLRDPAAEHGGAGRGERHPGVQRHGPPGASDHLDER